MSYSLTVLSLHSIVSWTTPSLRTHPVDVLTVVLDVTGLAVDTVGSVDHQTHVTRVIRLVFIDSCWAEPGNIITSIKIVTNWENI